MNAESTEQIDQLLAQFGPKRKLPFAPLRPYTELIQNLRKRGASFATVLEVLEHKGVETSHTSIRSFCLTVLGEQKRERPNLKRGQRSPRVPAIPSEGGMAKPDEPASSPVSNSSAQTRTKPLTAPPAAREREAGPRVANVEFIEEPRI